MILQVLKFFLKSFETLYVKGVFMKRSTLAKKFLILIGVTAGLAGCRLNDNAIRGEVDEHGNLLPIVKVVTPPPANNNSTNLNLSVTGDNMTVVEYKNKIGPAG